MAEELEWDGDWAKVTSATERQELEDELIRELSTDHILHGVNVAAVGRRSRRDDVLFRLADGRFAQVHLTRRFESSPEWPSTDIYESFAAWRAVPFEER